MSRPEPVNVQPYSAELNFTLDVGASFPYHFVWKQVNDPDFPQNPENPPTGIDLAGCTAVLNIKASHNSTTVQMVIPVVVEFEDEKGALNFEVTKEQIAELLPARSRWVHELIVTFPTTFVRKLVHGSFNLKG